MWHSSPPDHATPLCTGPSVGAEPLPQQRSSPDTNVLAATRVSTDPRRSDPDQIIQDQISVGARRSHGGPLFLIHEVVGCGAFTPTAAAPLLIANSRLLSPYKSPQLPSDQEDLAAAAGMGEAEGEGGQIWDSKMLTAEMDDFQQRRADGALQEDGRGLNGGGFEVLCCQMWLRLLGSGTKDQSRFCLTLRKTPLRACMQQCPSLPSVCAAKLANGFEVHFVQGHLLESVQHFLLVSWVCDPDLKIEKEAAETQVSPFKSRFVKGIAPWTIYSRPG